MGDAWKVELFLREFKLAWPPRYYVVNRQKNNQALADFGLMPRHRRDEIMALTVDNYCEGPDADADDPAQQVCVFGTTVGQREVYIKLTLKPLVRGFLAKCLSFHPAEHQLSYPLGKSNRR